MLGKIFIIVAVCAYSHAPAGGDKSPLANMRHAEARSSSDSMPALHLLDLKDVDSLLPDWSTNILTVKMKNGVIYQYDHPAWDYEKFHFALPEQVKKATDEMEKTFTKCEHPPTFPGGDAGLFDYLNNALKPYKDDFEGSDAFIIQCIVHLHGEIEEISIEGMSPHQAKLVKNALGKGPAWIPATQNGRLVKSYARIKMRLNI